MGGDVKKNLPETQVLSLKGGSAAQNAFIQMIDIFLGVRQSPEVKQFQREMCDYMPAENRALLTDFARKMNCGYNLGSYIQKKLEESSREAKHALDCGDCVARKKKNRRHRLLKAKFNACLVALRKFRKYHLGIAFRYITAGTKGTGSTDFKDFLKSSMEATSASRLGCTGDIRDAPHSKFN
eukprot:CAMPEP_0197534896 /NCGR_PEP_ID=MMETSP1318-20131121/48712_1 /TAXON_ID=552666 /ORGANISM="Partenskyella glossopodia, Strain RCC365" /LENGTH=181 /DNA_ID=CAMNT_0043092323 /DNA_START=38 /DNA_END=583 /DNA_ORIENTATION=-